MQNTHPFTRRDFITKSGTAVAASMLAGPAILNAQPRRAPMRVALVGTGIRGTTMWGRSLVNEYPDDVQMVGLCDINPGRLAFGKEYIGADCQTFTDFEQMMEETQPDRVIVTSTDNTHHLFIVRAMELGADVITEKPMTIDAEKCQAIIDAQEQTGRDIRVTFNYRYSPHRQTMKEMLMNNRIGRVTSVDFHWYLDVYHGADYFRRWHGRRHMSGSLFVHKACHHYDLLNWWLDSEPEEVYAMADLEYYGTNNPFRSNNCRGCNYKDECKHYWDITESERLVKLYVENEQYDGYMRDGCVWDDDITTWDKMSAQMRYANGVQVSYSCTTYSPYEGYRIAFNGTEGRLEAWVKERQPWEAEPYDEIRVTDNFGETELIQVSHAGGGHGGGDTRLKDQIFIDPTNDPFDQAAGMRDGAMAVLPGIAAYTSVDQKRPVKIAELTSLVPQPKRP